MGTASYPGAKKTYSDEVDKEDLAAASVINSVQDEVQAIEQELGINVAGSETDLVTRLGISIADDGAMKNGTSFPGSPSNGDFFYRSDQDVPYVYNGTTWKAFSAALQSGTAFPTGGDLYDGFMFYRTDENVVYVYNGSGWDAQGQSLSNVIFAWSGIEDANADAGMYIGSGSTTPAIGTPQNIFLISDSSSAQTLFHFRFQKLAGQNTITGWARLWSNDANAAKEAELTIDIGGQTGTVKSVASTSPAWYSGTVDVSGLTDSYTYECFIKLRNETATAVAYCSAITLIAS